jgi:hypothetical protein
VNYCHHFSSVVCRPSTFHILIFFSETTGPIATKLWWNGPWMAPFQNFVRWSRLPTKMAAKLKIEKGGMKFEKNLLLWNRGPSKDHSTKVWLQLVQWFLRRRLICDMSTDDRRRTKSDDNSSHVLKARWAKKWSQLFYFVIRDMGNTIYVPAT